MVGFRYHYVSTYEVPFASAFSQVDIAAEPSIEDRQLPVAAEATSGGK